MRFIARRGYQYLIQSENDVISYIPGRFKRMLNWIQFDVKGINTSNNQECNESIIITLRNETQNRIILKINENNTTEIKSSIEFVDSNRKFELDSNLIKNSCTEFLSLGFEFLDNQITFNKIESNKITKILRISVKSRLAITEILIRNGKSDIRNLFRAYNFGLYITISFS